MKVRNPSSALNHPTNPPITQPNTSPYKQILIKLTKWINTLPSNYQIKLLIIRTKMPISPRIHNFPKILKKVTNKLTISMKLLNIRHYNTLQSTTIKLNKSKFKRMNLIANSEKKFKIGIKMMIWRVTLCLEILCP